MNWELIAVVVLALQPLPILWWLVGDPWLDRQCAKAIERNTRKGEEKFQRWLAESRRVHRVDYLKRWREATNEQA